MKTTLPILSLRAVKALGVMALVLACSEPEVVPSRNSSTYSVESSGDEGRSSDGLRRSCNAGDVHYNLNVILQGAGRASGFIKFRQYEDEPQMIHLDTWIHGLEPNTAYQLQRAVDTTLDGDCTSQSWLTLGEGLEPLSIVTNSGGAGMAALFRSVASIPVGSTFDIHFRIVKENTNDVVLASDCHQYTIR